jgi:hypothetical protein
MATRAVDTGAPYVSSALNLGTGLAGNVASDVLDRGSRSGPIGVQITTVIGATPTVTFALEGSMDGTNWFPVPFTDPPAPDTSLLTTIVVTTAVLTRRYLRGGFPYRYFRVNATANTNVTFTVDVFVF